MPSELNVGHNIKDGVPVISVSYSADDFQSPTTALRFSSEIVKEYNNALLESPRVKSAVVDIHAKVAGSSLIRGLFELYRKVLNNSGQLVCVGFPPDYIPSLTSLGLLDQKGFSLDADLASAINRVKMG
jgi:hypothetical protein